MKSFRPVLLCKLLLLVPLAAAYAQAGTAEARRVATYDDKVGGSEAEMWHLEEFREKLEKEPRARGYVIAYGGGEDPPGKPRRYAARAKNWLTESRGVDARRLVALDGGRRESFVVELWLVPAGAPAPSPSPTAVFKDDPGDNLFYDEFSTGYDNFASRSEDMEAHLGGFAEALRREPKSWGCIVAYAETGDDRMGLEWDEAGTAGTRARVYRHYLADRYGLAASRLTAVDGGYSGRVVQLWIMRPGARFDSGPFVYPDRLRARPDGTLAINNRKTTALCCKACVRKGTDPYIRRPEPAGARPKHRQRRDGKARVQGR